MGSLNWGVPAWTFFSVISDVLILQIRNFFELAKSLLYLFRIKNYGLQRKQIKVLFYPLELPGT